MDVEAVAKGLTDAQRNAVVGWRFKSWVVLRDENAPLMSAGLIDVQRFPMRLEGVRKARLNNQGLAVREYLEKQNGSD